MSGSSTVLVLLVAALVAAPSSAPSRQPLVEGDPWIAFQAITSARGGAHAVHLIHPDGTGEFFALDMIPGGQQLHPDWSPDGRKIALDVDDGTPDIWVADTTDWTARKIVDCSAPCLWAQEPAWSHDGTQVAYQRHTSSPLGEVSTIELLDLASNSTSLVYEIGSQEGVYAPRWSPGDGSLVFEQTKSDGDSFVGVSLETLDFANPVPGLTRRIVPVDRLANNSDWSPDGSLIAFSAPIAGGEPGGSLSDIWVVHPDGSALRQVTDVAASGGTAVQPTFTPDGASIMFKLTDARVGADNAIATISIAGGDPQPATDTNYRYGWHPRARPIH